MEPLDLALTAEITAAETSRQSALISADASALDAILHKDLLHVHSRGNAQNKAEFIAHLSKMGGFVSIERGAVSMRLAGGAVILAGPAVNTVRRLETGEIAALNGFHTVVYTRGEAGRWQVIFSQMTPFSTS